jgi:predicted nuclease of predicted toxin-antitoxin system
LLDEHFNYTIAEELRRRGVDAVATQQERPELEGQDDIMLLRTAAAERRVVVTNNVRDYAPLVQEFGLRGETHFGVIFTDDTTFPRTHAGIGLIVRALAAFVEGATDDDLLNGCLYLPPPNGSVTNDRRND